MKALVPMAGLATRLFPFSKAVCKSFLPVLHADRGTVRPLLLCLVEAALCDASRVSEVGVVVDEQHVDQVRSFFTREPNREARRLHNERVEQEWLAIKAVADRVHVVVQPSGAVRGLGGAVLAGRQFLLDGGDDAFVLLLGDHLYVGSSCGSTPWDRSAAVVRSLVAAHGSLPSGASLTGAGLATEREAPLVGIMAGTPVPEVSHPDVCLLRVTDLVEKPTDFGILSSLRRMSPASLPAQHWLCNLGVDVLNKTILETLANSKPSTAGEVCLRACMARMAEDGMLFCGSLRQETHRIDFGSPHTLASAMQHMAERFTELYSVPVASSSSHTPAEDGVPTELLDFANNRARQGDQLTVCSAPGRVDILGGVADSWGSRVLQYPIAEAAHVGVLWGKGADDGLLHIESSEFGTWSTEFPSFVALLHQHSDMNELRPKLHELLACDKSGGDTRNDIPLWALYPLGVLAILFHAGFLPKLRWCFTGGLSIVLHSTVPTRQGLASSAAIEVATARALLGALGDGRDGPSECELAHLCQRAEQEIVGNPCGVMDQVTAAAGCAGRVLSLTCNPSTINGHVALPDPLAVWTVFVAHRPNDAWRHYAVAKLGADLGLSAIREQLGLPRSVLCSDLRLSQVESVPICQLPEFVTGKEVASLMQGRYSDQLLFEHDVVHSLAPSERVPVRACALHMVQENTRAETLEVLLNDGDWSQASFKDRLLGELFFSSHAGYDSMGLSSPEANEFVSAVRSRGRRLLLGARVTGAGCGGTVAIIGRHEGARIERVLRDVCSEHGVHAVRREGGRGSFSSATRTIQFGEE